MMIPWLFFLGAIILLVGIVVYTRKNRKKDQAIRREPPKIEKKTPKLAEKHIEDDVDLGVEPTDKKPSVSTKQTQQCIIILHLMAAENQPFTGYELLQALLSTGLRFGHMNIFHRHQNMDGTGEILFSVASIKEPGTFEMSKMGGFKTPGLAMFLRAETTTDPLHAFDTMLNTAKQLIDDLGGAVLDENRQPLEEEKISDWRNQIQQLLEKQQTPDLFEQTNETLV